MIIGILGEKKHGKDTIADFIVKKYNYEKHAFAKPLKEICRLIFGFTDEQLYEEQKDEIDSEWNIKPRDAFQFIGTELFRNNMYKLCPSIKRDVWVNVMKKKIEKNIKNNKNTIIADVRFQNEVDMIKKQKGIIIKVFRDNVKSSDNHESENNIKNIKNFDYLITNDGTLQELYDKIDNLFLNF